MSVRMETMLWEKHNRRRRRSSSGIPWLWISTVVVLGMALFGLVWAIFVASGGD
jgi:hypothetical protein